MIDEASSGPHDDKCNSSPPGSSKKGRRIRIQKATSDVASKPKLLLKKFILPNSYVWISSQSYGILGGRRDRRDSALERAEPNRPQVLSVLMAIPSESSTAICSHCDKAIPTSNIDLHYARCSRFLEKCTICGDMIPKKHAKEHYLKTHAPVPCSLCSEEIEREVLALHKHENCPQRIVTCEYCDFLLPAVDLSKHQEVCGNRPEYCDLCNKYIRWHELNDHEILLHSNSHYIAESSRNWSIPQREQGVPRRPGCNSSKRRILFSIAITGIAVLIGSMFIQRRPDSRQYQ